MKSEKKKKAELTSLRAQLDALNSKMGVVEGGKTNAGMPGECSHAGIRGGRK